MDYTQSLNYVNSFINYERTARWAYPEVLKLDRMRLLLRHLGNPQSAFPALLIAGSKGKGSTAMLLEGILRAGGYRTGLFTSPHLSDIRERIQTRRRVIPRERWCLLVSKVAECLKGPRWKDNPPTYFEVLTAVAFGYFREEGVDAAVLEVGLGGLYDSTNVVDAEVAGITALELEHTDKLGKTLEAIALQKCGILRHGQPVVSAPQSVSAAKEISRRVAEEKAALFRLGEEIRCRVRPSSPERQCFDFYSGLARYENVELGLLGDFQAENACLAIQMAQLWAAKRGERIEEAAVRRAMREVVCPGRLETVSLKPRVVADVAHTPGSVERVLAALKRHFRFRRLVVVLALYRDKDHRAILALLRKEAALLVATEFPNPRRLPAAELKQEAGNASLDVYAEREPSAAYRRALALATEEDLVLVAGSHEAAGSVREWIKNFKQAAHGVA